MTTRTQALLAEIARSGSTRESIARIYRSGIMECQEYGFTYGVVDWPRVNRALLKRYTPSGLLYIKTLAWSRKVIRS